MAFDFPDAPAVGDIHTAGGVDYQYAGNGVWNLASGGTMTDYVLKAGDTMTGALNTTGVKSIGDGTVGQLWLSAGDTTRCGNLEWRMQDGARQAYMGWGLKSDWISFKVEDGCKGLYMSNGADLYMGDGSGIHWGSTSAQTDVNNFSEGICLYGYGGTSQFGLNITSGTLNISVQNAGNLIALNIGGEQVMNVKSDGVRIPGGNLNVTGTGTFAGNVNIRDGDKLDMSNGYHITKIFGAATMQFHAGQNSGVFKFHITGFGDAYVIDKVGAVGNSYSATAPEAIEVAKALSVQPDKERGVDVMKVMAAMLAKMKLMEAEIGTLKGGKRR